MCAKSRATIRDLLMKKEITGINSQILEQMDLPLHVQARDSSSPILVIPSMEVAKKIWAEPYFARVESIPVKSFWKGWDYCLVPATGFQEHDKWFMFPGLSVPMGLYNGRSYVMITRQATPAEKQAIQHHRIPVTRQLATLDDYLKVFTAAFAA